MSFLGGRRTRLGPRGTRIWRGGLGYVADDHAFTRGPGAIASIDAATPVRRAARVQALSLSARRDAELARMTQPNARAVVGKVGGKRVLMPGQQATRPMRPGEIIPVKYPGMVGYQKPTKFGGGTGKRIGVSTGASGSAGVRASAAISPVLTYGGVGVGQPGTTVIAPQPATGNVSPYGGSADPSGAGGGDSSGGGASTGGGGGGGSMDPSGGEGGDAYDPSSDSYDDDIPDGTVDDGGGGGGGGLAPQPIPSSSGPIPSGPAVTTPSLASVPKWAWWAAAVAGAWWLFRK